MLSIRLWLCLIVSCTAAFPLVEGLEMKSGFVETGKGCMVAFGVCMSVETDDIVSFIDEQDCFGKYEWKAVFEDEEMFDRASNLALKQFDEGTGGVQLVRVRKFIPKEKILAELTNVKVLDWIPCENGHSFVVVDGPVLTDFTKGLDMSKAMPNEMKMNPTLAKQRVREINSVPPHKSWMPRQRSRIARFHTLDSMVLTHRGINRASTVPFVPERSPLWELGVRGEGQIVGIGDSGVETVHCSFAEDGEMMRLLARVDDWANGTKKVLYEYPGHRKISSYYSYAGVDDLLGSHGTGVASIIAGKCRNVSNLEGFDGMAPESKLHIFDLGRDYCSGCASEFPEDLKGMFDVAKSANVSIHSNSWGGKEYSYTRQSQSVDEFMFENQEFLVITSQGNDGSSPNGRVSYPANAKNSLSVGATLNSNRAFAYLNDTTCGNNTANCSQEMAFFSSSGPTSDGRIKPEVVAPGKYVIAAQVFAEDAFGPYEGTSFAAPVIAGNVALLRQYFMEGRQYDGQRNMTAGFVPMAALLKAVIVQSAMPLEMEYDVMMQGFGRPVLQNVVKVNNSEFLVDGKPRLEKLNVYGDFNNMLIMSSDGERQNWRFSLKDIPSTFSTSRFVQLRATLAWSDAPGSPLAMKQLVNDLDLSIKLNDNVYERRDRLNPLENIIIDNVAAETDGFEVEVLAHRITNGPQPFALAISVLSSSERFTNGEKEVDKVPNDARSGRVTVDVSIMIYSLWLGVLLCFL